MKKEILLKTGSPTVIKRNESLTNNKKYDAILILGNGNRIEDPTKPIKEGLVINGVSYVPSQEELARLVAGTELFRQGVTPLLLFSGGPSTRGSKVTEAVVAEHFLTNIGYEVDGKRFLIPRRALRTEKKALDTSMNLIGSQKFFDVFEIESLGLLTSASHLNRAGIYAGNLVKGVKEIGLIAAEDVLNKKPELAKKYPTAQKTITSSLLELWAKTVDHKGLILGEIAKITRR